MTTPRRLPPRGLPLRPPASAGIRRHGRMRRRVAAFLAVGAALALALLPATAASAHDYLVSSTPAAGSTVHAPLSRVTLTFDDIVLVFARGSTVLQVTGPGSSARHFETTCAHVANRTVSADVALGAPGKYTATWRVVSADGHPVTNSISFTYAPPTGTPAGKGSANGPSCGIVKGAPAAVEPNGGPSSGVPAAVWIVVSIVGGAIVLALIVLVVVVVLRLTRVAPGEQDAPDEQNPDEVPHDPVT